MNIITHCLWCKERKGRRRCPTLAGPICSRCCGENRLLRFDCLSNCAFLVHHEELQQERECQRYQAEWSKVNRTEKDDTIHQSCFYITYLLYQASKEIRRLTDDDVINTVEFLITQVSPIIIIARVPSQLSKLLWNKLASALERGEIRRDELIEALNRIQKIVTAMKNDKNRRAFLQGMITFYDKTLPAAEKTPSSLIFTPN
ncbi:hypothetical protein LM599_05150 [Candidatus Acetothermia bacterium]|nr:hypothetical protein [Candidatus Acetothermia bacterium]MCI2426886.1 hypothetical protein [Candidatus Acetothermia bacterium]MCI2428630.1 hypothetical protein [Candidatus Acetothermia bacterium]